MAHQLTQREQVDPRGGKFGAVGVSQPMRPHPQRSGRLPVSAEQRPQPGLGDPSLDAADGELFQVIELATGDLGSSASRKFDCEAWIPTQGKYRELTSTSNTTEFESRRLNIRMRDSAGTRPLATLNGTLCAVARTIVAVLENHQLADGSVRVPEVLRPYLGGRDVLEPAQAGIRGGRPAAAAPTA